MRGDLGWGAVGGLAAEEGGVAVGCCEGCRSGVRGVALGVQRETVVCSTGNWEG